MINGRDVRRVMREDFSLSGVSFFSPLRLCNFLSQNCHFFHFKHIPLRSVLLSLFWQGLVPSGPSFWVPCSFPRAGSASSSLRKLIGLMKATNLGRLAFFALRLLLCCSAPGFPLPFFEFQAPSPLVGSHIFSCRGECVPGRDSGYLVACRAYARVKLASQVDGPYEGSMRAHRQGSHRTCVSDLSLIPI